MFIHLLAQAADAAAATTPAPKVDYPVGTPQWKKNALDELFTLQFSKLDPAEWEYAAYQLGLRAIYVLVLLTLAWTLSSWAASVVRAALTRVSPDVGEAELQ